MSHRSNARALERLERACKSRGFDLAAMVVESYRQDEGDDRMIDATPASPTAPLGNYAGETPGPCTEPPPVAPASPPPPPGQRIYTRDIRPGPHDVLTWEEVRRVPWVDEMAERESEES